VKTKRGIALKSIRAAHWKQNASLGNVKKALTKVIVSIVLIFSREKHAITGVIFCFYSVML